jgi:hypothetical protein
MEIIYKSYLNTLKTLHLTEKVYLFNNKESYNILYNDLKMNFNDLNNQNSLLYIDIVNNYEKIVLYNSNKNSIIEYFIYQPLQFETNVNMLVMFKIIEINDSIIKIKKNINEKINILLFLFQEIETITKTNSKEKLNTIQFEPMYKTYISCSKYNNIYCSYYEIFIFQSNFFETKKIFKYFSYLFIPNFSYLCNNNIIYPINNISTIYNKNSKCLFSIYEINSIETFQNHIISFF